MYPGQCFHLMVNVSLKKNKEKEKCLGQFDRDEGVITADLIGRTLNPDILRAADTSSV